MPFVSASNLLSLAERSAGRAPAFAALSYLALQQPEQDAPSLERLALGERNRRLLRLRGEHYGDQLELHTSCPQCGEPLAVSLTVSSLLGQDGGRGEGSVEVAGRRVALRMLDSRDLRAAAQADDAQTGRRVLAARALHSEDAADSADIASLSPAEVEAIGAELAKMDALADICLAMVCPACGREWEASFDVCDFEMRDLAQRAAALLDDVDALARAYHWREADILAMTAGRRRAYLERIRSR